MRRALNVLSGQVYGKVDWVSQNKREVGMYIHSSSGKTTRCVVTGPEMHGRLANNVLAKGMMLTAFGEVYARTFHRKENNTYEGELVCLASRIIPEDASREGRVRGSIACTLKGVVMYWNPALMQVKSFLNFKEEGLPSQMTCSLYLGNWIKAMPEQTRTNFLSSLRAGREYNAMCMAEAAVYRSREGSLVPCLHMLPVDFRLQG